MSGVYKSLKVMVQDSLQRGKTDSTPLVQVENDRVLILNDEMEELERLVADRVGRLKAAVKEHEATAVDEAQHAEQLVESLNVSIAVLEAKLKETEDNVRRKEADRQNLEENLNIKVHDLQSEAKKTEQTLESRVNEVNDLKYAIDSQVKRIADLESAVEKAKEEAAGHIKQIAAVEAQLRDTEGTVSKQESTIQGLEQKLITRFEDLNGKIQDLESQVRNKEELLAQRDTEIGDLKSQLKVLSKGIGEMSSFIRQAEALIAVEGQGAASATIPNKPSKREEEKPAKGEEAKAVTSQAKASKVTPVVQADPQAIASRDVFDRVTSELTEALGIIKPMAAIIIRDHVVGLGESMEKFPKARIPELLESLSKEILDEKVKIDFRRRLADNGKIGGENARS